MALEIAMVEQYARPCRGVRDKGDFDGARLRRIRFGFASGTDLPGKHKSMRWLPRKNASPITAKAVRAALEAQASLPLFDADVFDHVLSPRMFARPPQGEVLGEKPECALGGEWHVDSAMDALDFWLHDLSRRLASRSSIPAEPDEKQSNQSDLTVSSLVDAVTSLAFRMASHELAG
jgi:hypothetical protein